MPDAPDPDSQDDARSAVELACDAITRHVASGRWSGGFTLTEPELMAQLQVSRSTVREALRRLQAEGLVIRNRSRNLMVRRLTRRDVAELYDLREALESYAAQRAAQAFARADASVQREFQAEAQGWRQVVRQGHGEALGEANRRFHEKVIALSANRHLPRLLGGTLMTLFASQFRPALTPESGLRAAAQHVEIADAIIAGDARAAGRAMKQHIRASADYIQALNDDAFEPDEG